MSSLTIQVFGHPHISVLDGGLPRWIAEGHEVENGAPSEGQVCAPAVSSLTSQAVEYPTPSLRAELVRSHEQMVANAETGDELVLDARAAPRCVRLQLSSLTAGTTALPPSRDLAFRAVTSHDRCRCRSRRCSPRHHPLNRRSRHCCRRTTCATFSSRRSAPTPWTISVSASDGSSARAAPA